MAAAVLAVAAPAAHAQDVHQEIIQRLDRIERLLRAGGGGGGGGSSEGVRSVANFACYAGSDCNSIAAYQCRQAGYASGVASRAEPIAGSTRVRVVEMTCTR
jgi:hypothetical protein